MTDTSTSEVPEMQYDVVTGAGRTWEIVFTDPKDSAWTIQYNGREKYIMNHQCPKGSRGFPLVGAYMHVGKCCMSCGDEYRPEFKGFFELAKFGAART